MIVILGIVLISMVAGAAVLLYEIRKRKIDIWLWSYLCRRAQFYFVRRPGPVHILFCFVDHFEPGWNKVDRATENARVKGWTENYPAFAQEFRDSEGFPPRHSWFYPPHYYRPEHLDSIIGLCLQGYGEVEMHMHHNRLAPFPDSSETLQRKFLECIELYTPYGIFKTRENGEEVVRYGFIHGDWALDGSRPQYCSVNNEITLLRETGCYADFTFPAYMVEAQPSIVNSIYYATDDPDRPKSYNQGTPMSVGGKPGGDLLMIQGPLGVRWVRRKKVLPVPKVDDGEISFNNSPTKERVDFWIKTGIHVQGRPEWVVVKVFTHGADLREQEVVLGTPIRQMHAYLNSQYNDGSRYRLHYVTARELYNILKAAEAGKIGDPGKYRDFILAPYLYCQHPSVAKPEGV